MIVGDGPLRARVPDAVGFVPPGARPLLRARGGRRLPVAPRGYGSSPARRWRTGVRSSRRQSAASSTRSRTRSRACSCRRRTRHRTAAIERLLADEDLRRPPRRRCTGIRTPQRFSWEAATTETILAYRKAVDPCWTGRRLSLALSSARESANRTRRSRRVRQRHRCPVRRLLDSGHRPARRHGSRERCREL